jgi:hypothetical protein
VNLIPFNSFSGTGILVLAAGTIAASAICSTRAA